MEGRLSRWTGASKCFRTLAPPCSRILQQMNCQEAIVEK
jgi:hypothetical protein